MSDQNEENEVLQNPEMDIFDPSKDLENEQSDEISALSKKGYQLLKENKIGKQPIQNKIVNAQTVKKQNTGCYGKKQNPGADDLWENSALLGHPRQICHGRRKTCKHRPTKDK